LDRNQYSTKLPGYLSLGTSYTKIERIVPSPTKILREPMPNDKISPFSTEITVKLRSRFIYLEKLDEARAKVQRLSIKNERDVALLAINYGVEY
jgi:hypothetical protein